MKLVAATVLAPEVTPRRVIVPPVIVPDAVGVGVDVRVAVAVDVALVVLVGVYVEEGVTVDVGVASESTIVKLSVKVPEVGIYCCEIWLLVTVNFENPKEGLIFPPIHLS